MAFVIKTKPIDDACPGQVLETINSDPAFNGKLCLQIIDTADGNWTFEFDQALDAAEDSHLNTLLSSWSCNAIPTDDGDYALNDSGGPASDIIWSSEKIDNSYIAIGDSINELGDVDISTIADDQLLIWSTASGGFVPIDKTSVGTVTSVFGRTGVVVAAYGDYNAGQITYDNSTSGLSATDVQSAIDEIDTRVDTLESSSHTHSNKAILDAITDAGSGEIITVAERTLLNSAIQPSDSVGALSDVDLTGVADGYLLQWNAANGRFETVDANTIGGVLSVNGKTGVVVLDTDDISEGTTNLYFTDARADARVTYETLDANGDVGTGANQVAAGDHNHDGVYEPADATILKQADVHDTPVNGATTNPISSNWANDHTDPALVADPHTQYQLESEKGQADGYTPLDSNAKVPSIYLPDSILGKVEYKGTWDASTNTPDLVNATPSKGDYYVVNVAGNTDLDGITDWQIGDWAIYNGTVWEKVDNTDSVTSVFGRQGDVTAQAGDYTASQVTNVPSGNISATDVQTALNELDSEKVAKSGDTMSGDLNFDANAVTFTIPGDAANSSKIETGTTSLDIVSTQDVKLSGTGLIIDIPGNTSGYYIQMGSNGSITFVQEPTTTWGNITGTLSNQTDLQNALDAKADANHSHAAVDITYDNTGTNITATNVGDALTELDGDLSTIDSNKADKVSGATNGNLAGLDASGNLTDSGIAATDVIVKTDSIDELADVDTTTTSPTVGQVLVWDGSNWVPGSNTIDKLETILHNGIVTQTIGTTSFVTLLFGSTMRSDAPVTYSAGTITFTEAGKYTITYEVSTTAASNTRSSTEVAAYLNGALTQVGGSRMYTYDRRSNRGESTGTATISVDVNANDTLNIKAKANSGNTVTLANACRLIIEKG